MCQSIRIIPVSSDLKSNIFISYGCHMLFILLTFDVNVETATLARTANHSMFPVILLHARTLASVFKRIN